MSARSALLVMGASGVGKTSALEELAGRCLPNLHCYFFDSIGVPSPEVMLREFGGGEAWQFDATRRWLVRLATELRVGEVGVLEGQTRPSFVREALDGVDLEVRMVLLDCRPEVRTHRLELRGQPDLASDQMQSWAVYLRGQADALDLPVIDTSESSVDAVADALASLALGGEARASTAAS